MPNPKWPLPVTLGNDPGDDFEEFLKGAAYRVKTPPAPKGLRARDWLRDFAEWNKSTLRDAADLLGRVVIPRFEVPFYLSPIPASATGFGPVRIDNYEDPEFIGWGVSGLMIPVTGLRLQDPELDELAFTIVITGQSTLADAGEKIGQIAGALESVSRRGKVYEHMFDLMDAHSDGRTTWGMGSFSNDGGNLSNVDFVAINMDVGDYSSRLNPSIYYGTEPVSGYIGLMFVAEQARNNFRMLWTPSTATFGPYLFSSGNED